VTGGGDRPDEPTGETQARVVGAVGVIAAATLGSRLLGYVRDMVIAHAFGAGPATDAFFVAFRIPNLLRRLLGEGALSTAVIPVFSEHLARHGPEGFARMLRAVAGAALCVLGLAAASGMLLAPWIVAVMAPGWTDEPGQLELAVRLTRMMFPYVLLVGLGALATGVLNVHHRFFAAAAGPAVLNVALIGCVLGLSGRLDPPILALAVGVLVGGLGQVLVQLPEVRGLGLPLLPSTEWRHPAIRVIALRLAPAVFGLAAVHVTVLVNTLLASLLPAGTVSALYYADRVMEFPLGVFGIALATAALPGMAVQAARGERRGLAVTLGWALRLSAAVSVPAAVGLLALAGPIVRLLFQRGEFGAPEALVTAQALMGYAVGLPAFAATRLAAQTFYALGDTATPVRVGLGAVGVNVALALVLMWPLGGAGLALASSLSAWVNLGLLAALLRHRLGPLGRPALGASALRTLVATLPMLAWCLTVAGESPSAWRTLGAVGGGVPLYAAAALILRAPEMSALLGGLAGRLGLRWPRPG
jgi:putative peptidoglycan lipid II flippase